MKVRCSSCNGKGEVPTGHSCLYGAAYGRCEACLGFGFVFEYRCEACMDTGLEDIVNGDPVPCPACSGLVAVSAPDVDRGAHEEHLDRVASFDSYVEAKALRESTGTLGIDPDGFVERMA